MGKTKREDPPDMTATEEERALIEAVCDRFFRPAGWWIETRRLHSAPGWTQRPGPSYAPGGKYEGVYLVDPYGRTGPMFFSPRTFLFGGDHMSVFKWLRGWIQKIDEGKDPAYSYTTRGDRDLARTARRALALEGCRTPAELLLKMELV